MRLISNDRFREEPIGEADLGQRKLVFTGATDASADPLAGGTAANGKPIWTEQQAAANLNREGYSWNTANGDALSDRTLSFGFWKSIEELQSSYYVSDDGTTALNEAFYGEDFLAFNATQQGLARDALGQWGEFINVKFEETSATASADITFGTTDTGPASGAYAYLPSGDAGYAVLEQYGFSQPGKLGGDVWINNTLPANYAPTDKGSYAYFTVMHELGHALGLEHPGDYNASDDNDGDGAPDPITYQNDAYFFQDSNQYSIMSYFGEDATGGSWVDWQQVRFTYAMTPMVHDILAVQTIYGANTTTRTGDTTYGFNSNAGAAVFDFNLTPSPVVTVYDAGGTDTFDFSGFDTDQVINLNQGAFSSASEGASLEYLKSVGFLPESYTEAQLQRLFASYGSGAQGQMQDNIAIAYGATIENATSGAGDDLLIGNEVANVLDGNAGFDVASYRDADAGVVASLALNRGLTGDARGDRYSDIEGLEGSAHNDVLDLGNKAGRLAGLAGNDVLTGGNAADQIDGGEGKDVLYGGNGDDLLKGGAGDDILWGGNGKDTLYADGGKDALYGGNGSDTFVFTDLAAVATLLDFKSGTDLIDLSGLDAISATDALDAFTWIGGAGFGGEAGELRFGRDGWTNVLYADLDGDKVADFSINLGFGRVGEADLLFA